MFLDQGLKGGVEGDIVSGAGEEDVGVAVIVWLTGDKELAGFHKEAHLKEGYGGLAGAEDIHYYDLRLFKVVELPIDLIIHFLGGAGESVAPGVVKNVATFVGGECFNQSRLPILAVPHIDRAGKEDRDIISGPDLLFGGFFHPWLDLKRLVTKGGWGIGGSATGKKHQSDGEGHRSIEKGAKSQFKHTHQ